jgi:transposase
MIKLAETAMKKCTVTLTENEREELSAITCKGSHKSQKVLNALILLNCDEGEHQARKSRNEDVSTILQISMKKIDRVKRRFVEEGLEIALNGHRGQRVYKKKVDGDLEARLIALSCSEAPQGFTRWSLRMLADKAVELEYTDGISHETVRRLLKKRVETLEKKGMGNSSPAKR